VTPGRCLGGRPRTVVESGAGCCSRSTQSLANHCEEAQIMVKARLDDPLTADQLRSLLRYLPVTGFFVWNHNPQRTRDWNTRYAGTKAGTPTVPRGYIQIMVNKRLYLGHRLAFLWMNGSWPEFEIDHIDGDPANNAWGNLRHATRSQQLMNAQKRSDNASGHKGVHWSSRRHKWVAEVMVDGKKHTFGHFNTIEEAKAARDFAAKRLHGAFTRID
jgi:hypothetical protein